MGTTLIAGLFENNKGIIAHVGDSRVYLNYHIRSGSNYTRSFLRKCSH